VADQDAAIYVQQQSSQNPEKKRNFVHLPDMASKQIHKSQNWQNFLTFATRLLKMK